jgi:hypothetical protein
VGSHTHSYAYLILNGGQNKNINALEVKQYGEEEQLTTL